jgi:hypothetical protein
MRKIILASLSSLMLLACSEEKGPSGPNYDSNEITEERIFDKSGVWVMNSTVANAAQNDLLPPEVAALAGENPYSTYLLTGSLTLTFAVDEVTGNYLKVDYVGDNGHTESFFYNSLEFTGTSIILNDQINCIDAGSITLCEAMKTIKGNMTENYLVLEGSPFLQNTDTWKSFEIFQRSE